VEKMILSWCNRWLSRAGRLVLLKSIIEVIHVYWTSLAWVPKGMLHKINQMATCFLWAGKDDSKPLVLALKITNFCVGTIQNQETKCPSS
jgi:hypothetical protein